MKLAILIILSLSFCGFAQRSAYFGLEFGPGFSQEIDYYSNNIGTITNAYYKYSELIDINGALGYDINSAFLADFEVNPTFYTYSKEIGIFYNLGIKARFRIIEMNNYLKLRLGIHQLFVNNNNVNNVFGVGINIAAGIELTNSINAELGFKAITGELKSGNSPQFVNSNIVCDYTIYSISIRFIYLFRFKAFE
jgi:hypothetical protein